MSEIQAQTQSAQATGGESQSPADPLAGDWSEGLPGPVRAHGLPLPHRLGEARLPAPIQEEPLRPMETPWSEPAQTLADAAWSMAPPPASDSPGSPAGQPSEDWPTSPPLPPASDEMWSAPAAAQALADWSAAPSPPQPVRTAPSSAAPEDGSWAAPPPGTGEDLSPEPAAPKWTGSAKPEFAPLPPGASLAADEEEGPRAIDEGEAASLLRPVDDAAAMLRPIETAANDRARVETKRLVPPATKGAGTAPRADIVHGEHRVAIHARGGRTRRGSVTDVDLSRAHFALQPPGAGGAEIVAHADLKAIFFMLAPGENAPAPTGPKVRVTFSDGRTIEGHRDGPDVRQGFFLIPLDAQKTNTKRIYVAKAAVSSVADT